MLIQSNLCSKIAVPDWVAVVVVVVVAATAAVTRLSQYRIFMPFSLSFRFEISFPFDCMRHQLG